MKSQMLNNMHLPCSTTRWRYNHTVQSHTELSSGKGIDSWKQTSVWGSDLKSSHDVIAPDGLVSLHGP